MFAYPFVFSLKNVFQKLNFEQIKYFQCNCNYFTGFFLLKKLFGSAPHPLQSMIYGSPLYLTTKSIFFVFVLLFFFWLGGGGVAAPAALAGVLVRGCLAFTLFLHFIIIHSSKDSPEQRCQITSAQIVCVTE